MKKCYIAGPIGSMTPAEYLPPFYEAHHKVLADGLEPVNPILLVPPDEKYRDAIRTCINALIDCDYIYLLKGWENSKGARAEFALAKALGIEIYPYPTYKDSIEHQEWA